MLTEAILKLSMSDSATVVVGFGYSSVTPSDARHYGNKNSMEE
jgi:hypothetical protein